MSSETPNKEEVILNTKTPEKGESIVETSEPEVGSDVLKIEIDEIDHKIEGRKDFIENRTIEVDDVRQKLGMPSSGGDIPVVDQAKIDIEKALLRKAELETKLQEIISSDVSSEYQDLIDAVRQSKVDWANSSELERRLRLKGADDEDVVNIRAWLVGNAKGTKTIVLSKERFNEAVDVLAEMTSDSYIKQGSAFHVPGGRDDVPDNVKDTIFLKENQLYSPPPRPPVPGKVLSEAEVLERKEYVKKSEEEKMKKGIDVNELHHEFGHSTQDGLLDSELYKDWKPKMKDSAPDQEYIGKINETDTRVRAMFRDLSNVFDPIKGKFGPEHIAILKNKKNKGELSKDTLDLLAHYEDENLIDIANTLPAI